VHFNGQFIDSSVALKAHTVSQRTLGDANGYQHMWLQAQGEVSDAIAKVTWLKDKTFYTHTTVGSDNQELLMVRLGANDPNFNLIANQALINRVKSAANHQFLSVLEVHGEYNGSQEFTINSRSQLTHLENISEQVSDEQITLIKVTFAPELTYLLAIAKDAEGKDSITKFTFEDKEYEVTGNAQLISM
jgi:hypothetical protein